MKRLLHDYPGEADRLAILFGESSLAEWKLHKKMERESGQGSSERAEPDMVLGDDDTEDDRVAVPLDDPA